MFLRVKGFMTLTLMSWRLRSFCHGHILSCKEIRNLVAGTLCWLHRILHLKWCYDPVFTPFLFLKMYAAPYSLHGVSTMRHIGVKWNLMWWMHVSFLWGDLKVTRSALFLMVMFIDWLSIKSFKSPPISHPFWGWRWRYNSSNIPVIMKS